MVASSTCVDGLVENRSQVGPGYRIHRWLFVGAAPRVLRALLPTSGLVLHTLLTEGVCGVTLLATGYV